MARFSMYSGELIDSMTRLDDFDSRMGVVRLSQDCAISVKNAANNVKEVKIGSFSGFKRSTVTTVADGK